MANDREGYSIIPPSAVYGENWPLSGVIPQGLYGALSVAGWTSGNEGFQQQTFLGASIRSFSVSAGFGDTSSTMGIELVNDEYNNSEGSGFGLGLGDDPYHTGSGDKFNPPVVGSPVFFKFGKNYATVEQAFRRTLDETYPELTPGGSGTLGMPADPFPQVRTPLPVKEQPTGYYLMEKDLVTQEAVWIDKSPLLNPNTKWRGFNHFAFGGVLQSYTENRSSAGNPLYSVKIVDPREILSNTEMLLNNYQGTTFGNKNLFNIYGFLEYDVSDKLAGELESKSTGKEVLKKYVTQTGDVSFSGLDIYNFPSGSTTRITSNTVFTDISGAFPITGQGFSRRSSNGIPWYRVEQAMNAMFGYDGKIPKEYEDSGFGGVIDFRGYNYVVDWRGIPTKEIPYSYYLNFDKINMLDLAQELCDVLSRELYVSLLPIIDHPGTASLFAENQKVIAKANAATTPDEKNLILGSGLVTGLIRIDTIDKKKPPVYGAVKKYLDDLEKNDIYVENRDVGFELSNVVTDRFVVGAQEVEMYYFNTLRDRDNYLDRLKDTGDSEAQQRLEQLGHDKWTIQTNQNQQVLPFYGFLGDNAVTIPRGFGSYQQIMLDTRGVDAHGVGAYYVATEMELRAASVSFKAWSDFLLGYNELYIQELSENQAFYASLSVNMTEEVEGINDQLDEDSPLKEQLKHLENRNFGVSVPRSVWNSAKSDELTAEVEDNPNYDPTAPQGSGNEPTMETGNNLGGPFKGKMGKDGYPASPCNPPFGYPLYYKRAEKLGLPRAGMTNLSNSITTIITNIENLENKRRSDRHHFSAIAEAGRQSIKKLEQTRAQWLKRRNELAGADGGDNPESVKNIDIKIKTLNDRVKTIEANVRKQKEDMAKMRHNTKIQIAQMKDVVKGNAGIIKNISRFQRDNLQNAKKVYNFVKKVADDNLGKKFLVKIPRACNVNYASKIKKRKGRAWDVVKGPFGFDPQPISQIPDFKGSDDWKDVIKEHKKDAITAERKGPTPADAGSSGWPTKSNIHWHYLDVHTMGAASTQNQHANTIPYGSGYTYGALKCNFNPITQKWEFNYKPEPQGGFFNYALYDKNLSAVEANVSGVKKSQLPKITQSILAPKLLDKLVTNGNRINCYVRYDHSQHLDFSNINAKDIEQQTIGEDGKTIIPDVMENLPNLKPDQKGSMDAIQARIDDDKDLERQAQSVAFVKCTVDERFYMSPKVEMGDARVWAEDFSVNITPQPYEVVYVPSGNKGCKAPKEVMRRPVPSFGVPGVPPKQSNDDDLSDEQVSEAAERGLGIGSDTGESVPESGVTQEGGGLIEGSEEQRWDDFAREWSDTYKAWTFRTDEKNLDPEHVYALITVPGRVIPTVDSRYVDGPLRALNGASIANALTEDVVKIDEFAKPGFDNEEDKTVRCEDLPSGVEFSFSDLSRAAQASKDASKGISLSNNGETSIIAFTSPSPVYPDIVALPLMSMERCYGPWLSAALNGKQIGGTIKKYSDIGGKIEFVKDEKLAPWNYAGFALMDEAAKLKTQFSNSLLLFSERGSFSYADAPLDVSLAKALRDKGPLVTSISVDIGQAIKTSVKLDLYTSQFGKLQKQKEIAISQISRERQKIIDQNNNLERRGIGKGGANMNLMGTLLENGGQSLLDAAKTGNEIFTEFEKGNQKSASLITISATPNTQTFGTGEDAVEIISEDSEGAFQSPSQLQEKKALIQDEKQLKEAEEKTAATEVSSFWKGFKQGFGSAIGGPFATKKPDRRQQINQRTLGGE